ncbi:MAG: FMN-binding negative transcriptional regulator [Povalibacter sp.]
MYIPQHFAETRPEELLRILERNPLGALITHGRNGLDANHLPFELDLSTGKNGVLRGHVARANPVWQDVEAGSDVLVVFRAMDAYISPNWYPSKVQSERQVPTWNYQVLNVHGNIRIIDDAKFVQGVVARLTRVHEASIASERPWKMGDAPPDYIEAMLKMIVGIEVEVTRMVGKSKLGQNREERDRIGAARGLATQGHHAISDAMLSASALKPMK